MIYKKSTGCDDRVLVTFEIPGSVWAERIHLVGDFNEWDRENLPLRLTRQGNWQIEIELTAGREYRFRYLIDGEGWGNDWHADDHTPGVDGLSDSVVVANIAQTRDLALT
ncbi:MAG: isoamylase early set domain-containing protein [Anaerolineae bacterium]